ncbi:hypothetical protein ACNI65_07865 [Roseateles sp. So40a]|uniref:hypothetical protein n=1 Tax=Roseateles sp. So40a TaxID=3400226 RepID=UPI003A8ADC37
MLQAPIPSFQRFAHQVEVYARVAEHAPLFPRPALAAATVQDLLSVARSRGLLLTGGRFTGKSTFLRHDLLPLLRSDPSLYPIVIDFMAHEEAEPGAVILQTLCAELQSQDGVVRRTARKLGLTGLSLGGMQMSPVQAEADDFKGVLKMLRALSAKTGRRLILLLDEVQRTQTSDHGRRVLLSLARSVNSLNVDARPGPRILATGSHAHKLRKMTFGKEDAFHGATVRALPPLGGDYLQWLHAQVPVRGRPSSGLMASAFDRLLHRPRDLISVCQVLASYDGNPQHVIDRMFHLLVEECADDGKTEFLLHLRDLPDLPLALSRVMAEAGPEFAPFQLWCKRLTAALVQARRKLPAPPEFTEGEISDALNVLVARGLIWRGLGFVFEHARFQRWILSLDPAVEFGLAAPGGQPVSALLSVASEQGAPRLVS